MCYSTVILEKVLWEIILSFKGLHGVFESRSVVTGEIQMILKEVLKALARLRKFGQMVRISLAFEEVFMELKEL